MDIATNIQVEPIENPALPDAPLEIQVELNDGPNTTQAGTITLERLASNAPPTVENLPVPVTIIEDVANSSIDFSDVVFDDFDSPSIRVTFQTAGFGALVPFGALSDDSSIGGGVEVEQLSSFRTTLVGAPADINAYLDVNNLTITPPENLSGLQVGRIDIEISDGPNTVLRSIRVDITPVNDPPTGTPGTLSVAVAAGPGQTLDLSNAQFSDIDSETVTVTVELVDSASTFATPADSAALSVTPTLNSATIVSITGRPEMIAE